MLGEFMDLFSLDASPAQLVKSQTKVNYTKLDPEKLRQSVQSLNESKNLIDSDDVMNKLDTSSCELLQDSKISHAATIFFESKPDATYDEDGNITGKMYVSGYCVEIKSDGNITVMDTKFSKDEFQNCRDLIQSMRSDVKTKSFLDYDDYAKQSIMTNIVTTYAKNNLNEDQAKVLTSAVKEYVNSQQDLATENSSKETISSFSGIKDYYGKSNIISKEQAGYINESFNKIGLKTNVKEGTETILPQATNEDVINSITSLFSNVNLNDPDEFDKALSSYQELLKPVYSTLNAGISDKELNNLVQSKSNDLSKLVNKYRSYMTPSISDYA